MKRNLFIIVLIITLVDIILLNRAYSQNNCVKRSCCKINKSCKEIIFKKGKCCVSIPNTFKVGDQICIKIRGFNPLIYNFQISTRDSFELNSNIPGLIKGLFINNYTDIIKGIQESLSSTSDENQFIEGSISYEIDSNDSCLKQYIEYLYKLGISPDSIRNVTLRGFRNTLCNYLAYSDSLRLYESSLNLIAMEKVKILLIYKTLNEWDYTQFEQEDDEDKYMDLLRLQEGVKYRLSKMEMSVNDYRVQNNKLEAKFTPFKILGEEYGKSIKLIREAIQGLDTLLTISDYLDLKVAYQNYINNEEYVSFPIQINQESKIINVKVSPFEGKGAAPSFNGTYFIKPSSRYYFGFSSGFYISDVRGHNYSSKAQQDGLGGIYYTIIPESVPTHQVGVQSMVHAGVQIWNDLYFQSGIGPTLGYQNKLVPGLAAGLGIAIGTKYKLTITGGIHLSYVERLSNAYDLQDKHFQNPSTFVVDNLIRGGFISIGYNFINF